MAGLLPRQPGRKRQPLRPCQGWTWGRVPSKSLRRCSWPLQQPVEQACHEQWSGVRQPDTSTKRERVDERAPQCGASYPVLPGNIRPNQTSCCGPLCSSTDGLNWHNTRTACASVFRVPREFLPRGRTGGLPIPARQSWKWSNSFGKSRPNRRGFPESSLESREA